jgi:AraC family transcriptional regulator, regulatory protein of adaptative response / DNA-3-methyladenine glycosylase II
VREARELVRTVATAPDIRSRFRPEQGPPSDIPPGVENAAKGLPLDLPYRPPFAVDALLSFLGARAVPGVEVIRDGTYRRGVRAAGGGTAVIGVTPDPTKGHVTLDVSAAHGIDRATLARDSRRAFDLDADSQTIDAALARDPELAPLVRRTPGLRVPGTFDAFELVVRAIFGQQVSVLGARTSLGRFAARFGAPLDPPSGGITYFFPSAERVAEISPEALEMPRARAEAIRRVGHLVASGEIDLTGGSPLDETLRILGEVRGIGPWTLAYVAMRALRDPDAFMAGDLGVRKGFERLGMPATPRELLERADRWRPWRAYAVMRLWSSLA